MARAVEGRTLLLFSWKALTDVVEKWQEEAARILQLEELENRDQILDIVQHQHSSIRASLDEASPDLGGETLLEDLLIHHTTLSEPLDGQGVEHCQEILEVISAAQELHYCVHLFRQKLHLRGEMNDCLVIF